MDMNLAHADVPGIPVSLKSDTHEQATFCVLCLRERPSNTEFHQFNSVNGLEFRETLKRTIDHDLNLEEFNICTTCSKLLQLLDEFRVCCSKAVSWAEQRGVGLKCSDEWFFQGTAQAIGNIWTIIHDQVILIEEKSTSEDRVESAMSIEEVKVEPSQIEEDHTNPLKDDDEPQNFPEVEETPTKEAAVPEADLDVYKCSRCGTFFDFKSGLHVHMRRCWATEKRTKMHSCELCEAAFSTKALLKAHMNRHEGKKPFPCRINCDESFYSPVQRYTHEGCCRGRQETCSMCGNPTTFPNRQSLNEHLEGVHGVTMHQCKRCGKKFDNRGDLSRHQILKHGTLHKTPIELVVTPEVRQDSMEEEKDKVERKTRRLQVLNCDRCKRTFDNQQGLNKHQLRCDGVEMSYSYTCQICSVSFQFPHMLEDHMNKHKGKKPYICRKGCGKSFHRTSNRSIHEMQCGTGEQTCTICNAKLTGKRSLDQHTRTVHAETRFPCETCGASFKQKRAMLKHTTLHTGNQRIWSCKMCDKKFTTAYAAKEHLNSHTREKVYTCKFCEETYLYKASYRRHLRLCASGGRGAFEDN